MLKRKASSTSTTSASSSPQPTDGHGGKKKRKTQPVGNLTNAQKRMLCVKFSQVKMTQQELCHWAKKEFNLVNLPHQSTISKILSRAGELTTMTSKDLSARRKGLVTHPELDTALCNWVLFARQHNLKLSGDIIKEQARELASLLGITSTMTFSNGWLGGFKKRHNIRLGNSGSSSGGNSLTGTSAGVTTNSSAVAQALMDHIAPNTLPVLQQIANLYAPRDIFTMSETGLFYALSPEKPAGRGKQLYHQNDRFTIAFAVNSDGSERLEPMFIGNTRLLRPKSSDTHDLLKHESDDDLLAVNSHYRDNKRAWMTPVLFQEWVGALDSKLRDQERRILLLVPPAPAHIAIGLELTNIRLEMFPPALGDNTSNSGCVQPLEGGIFAAFKRRYRRYHMCHALDRHEGGLKDDLFHVDPLQAMRWTRHCWKEIPDNVIRHYWNASGILALHKLSEPTALPVPAVGPVSISAESTSEVDGGIKDEASRTFVDEAAMIKAGEEEITCEVCDTVSALEIFRPMAMDEFITPTEENLDLHCAGTHERDFVDTVSSTQSTYQYGNDSGKSSMESRLKELLGSSGTSSQELQAEGLLANDGGSTDHVLDTKKSPPASNEQLIECFKVLLPELDRLRFDEHAKKSIRTAFRKLREAQEQTQGTVSESKRSVVRKPQLAQQQQLSPPQQEERQQKSLAVDEQVPPAEEQQIQPEQQQQELSVAPVEELPMVTEEMVL